MKITRNELKEIIREVIIDKKGGKNLMRVEEFRVDDYPEFALNAGLD